MNGLMECGRTIVVGSSLDRPSAVALRRGVELARAFDARLCIVHSLTWGRPLLVDQREMTRAVVDWARKEAQTSIEPSNIVCTVVPPASALANIARTTDAALVIIGASRPRHTPGVARQLAQVLDTTLLVAQPPRRREELVAATDLRDRAFPIVRAAASFAGACSARLTLVHNFEGVSAVERRRLGSAMRNLVGLASSLPPVRRAHFAVFDSTPDAISEIASANAADLVIVGARPGRAHTLTSLLASTSSSVLAIPIRTDAG